MIVCFAFVITLALTADSQDGAEPNEEATSKTMGIIVCLLASMCLSGMQITNRKLQGTSFVVLNYWHSILGFTIPCFGFGLYAWITGASFLSYPAPCYFWILLGSVTDTITATCNCIAFQNDKSSFISILAYSSVAFAFIFDTLIFKTVISQA